MSATAGPVVRTYGPDDLRGLREVFHRAGAGDLPVFGRTGDESIWLRPYVELSPATVLLALLDGDLMGYLAARSDAKSPDATCR